MASLVRFLFRLGKRSYISERPLHGRQWKSYQFHLTGLYARTTLVSCQESLTCMLTLWAKCHVCLAWLIKQLLYRLTICCNLETTSTKISTVKQGTSQHFAYRPDSEHYYLTPDWFQVLKNFQKPYIASRIPNHFYTCFFTIAFSIGRLQDNRLDIKQCRYYTPL